MTQPKTKRKQLTPFGGINSRAQFEKLKQEALLTRSRQECFELGYISVRDLDDEELAHGRCRDESGNIPARTAYTQLIPSERYDEMVAEHELRYKHRLRENLYDMLDIMIDIAKDDTVEPRDRFEAAKYLTERVVGKTADKIDVTVKAAPWEDLLSQVTGIASVSRAEHRQLQSGIIEAEFEDVSDEQGGDDQETTELLEPDQTGQESAIRQAQASEPANMEQDQVDDVDAHTTTAPNGQAPSQAGAQGQETAQPMPSYPAKARPEGLPQPIPPGYVANNDKQVYTDGQIETYGHRKAEGKSYAEQARAAQELAVRRAEAKASRQEAKKRRKIARAMGADAIKDEITGASVSEDGEVRFE